ncbi:MAG: hypothetical protein ACTSP4_01390 [Candidatus Hodarchaeales archaeon]
MYNHQDSLSKYICTKCGNRPENRDFFLKGCSCGNGFFRVVTKNVLKEKETKSAEKEVRKVSESDTNLEMDRSDNVAQVCITNGSFKIDVESLFKNSEKPVIIKAGGVYKIINPSRLD